MTRSTAPSEQLASRLQIVREGRAEMSAPRIPRRGKITVDIESVVPDPRNERRKQRGIEELAETIKSHGIIEPPTAVPLEDGRFMLTTGHRRLQAVKLAGKKRIDIIVGDPEEESKRRIKSLISNVQREDLGPVELANALQDMKDDNPDIKTNRDLATLIGKSEQWVGQMLKILSLAKPMQEQLSRTEKQIPYDVAIEIARVKDKKGQEVLVRQAVEGATVRAIRGQAKDLKTSRTGTPNTRKTSYITKKIKTARGLVIIHHDAESATREDHIAALEDALDTVRRSGH